MLVLGDLGFTGLVLVFFLFFFFCPVLSFLIQKKWRIAVEKKEEIMRLVAMASEEAARAEFEASAGGCCEEFLSLKAFKCAVCYCPTTTRCSRCKLVRYCSGKCQIIHWRRGHREECRPPSTIDAHLNGPESDSDQYVLLQREQYKFYGKGPEMESQWNGKGPEMESQWNTKASKKLSKKAASSKFSLSPESTSGREDDKVNGPIDDNGVQRDFRFSDSSNFNFSSSMTSNDSDTSFHNFSTSTASNESLADVPVDEGPVPPRFSRSRFPAFNEVSPDVVENGVHVNGTNSFPPEFTDSVTSVHTISFPSRSKSKRSSSRPAVLDCEPPRYSGTPINGLDDCTVPEPFTYPSEFVDANINVNFFGYYAGDNGTKIQEDNEGISPDYGAHPRFPCNSQTLESDDANLRSVGNRRSVDRGTLSEKTIRNARSNGGLLSKPSKLSDSASKDQNNDNILESKERRSLSSNASERQPSSGTRRSSTSCVKPPKVDKIHVVPIGLSEITSSLPNASNGLKTSVRRVVQQLRAPKSSKHNPFGLSVGAERNSYKMLFSYELFIKLYNWGKVELLPCGLMNCGNSCYANAVIQCLAFTQPLTAYLLQGIHSKACPRRAGCFTCEFECLIQKAREGNSPLSPIGILSQLQGIGSHLGHGKEEDAHEFLRYAIDTMQSICLKEAGVYALSPLAEETTLVGLIFGGYLRSKIKCMKCHSKTEQHERMMDLTVEIQGDIGTLEEALAKFTATEILDGENKYLCNRCKSYEKAKKKLTVLEAPNVLTIAFKRFQSGKFGKLNKSIRFPEILNLGPYMSGKSDKSHEYRLYGVVVHVDVRNAAFSGHYVCYVKNLQGKWFKTDDSTVKPVEVERVLSKGAYMLLYSRCSPQPPSFVRNTTTPNGIKIKRDKPLEAVTTNHVETNRAKFSSAALRAATSYPHKMTVDSLKSLNPFNNRRLHQITRGGAHHHNMDSSSDSSSLFSCSDEGSCSTESTRDSTSTDDLSDYIFGGESRYGWNSRSSPWRGSDDSDVSCSGYPPMQVVVDGETFLYSDYTAQNCRNDDIFSVSCNSSTSGSSSEANLEHLGWGNPLLRRPAMATTTWERTAAAQTFY
ncbi:ubiquitinyl hydrolase 1 [Ranunculus cassubicifolius]